MNQAFREQRMGSRGPVNWPAQSPGLNLLDFLAMGTPKELVYSVVISDLEILE
jgi:hypothetical protein